MIQFLKTNFGIDEKDEVWVEKYFEKEYFKKNEIILKSGEICKKLYFVEKGILRTFHTNQNGTEFTRLIVKENEFCTILLSFTEKVSSAASIQSLTDACAFSIHYSDFKDFISKSENAKNIYTKMLERFQNFQIKRVEFLTQFSPLEKTKIFLEENPDLIHILSSKVISSYLQITPETYSRCKKILRS